MLELEDLTVEIQVVVIALHVSAELTQEIQEINIDKILDLKDRNVGGIAKGYVRC